MNRGLILFVLILLVSGVLVSGQGAGSESGGGTEMAVTGSGTNGTQGNRSTVDLKGALEQARGELGNAPEGAKAKTNEILAKEIQIPQKWQFLTRVVFGLRADNKVDLQTFIILITWRIFVLLFIHSTLKITPWFNTSEKAWVGAILVNLVVGLTGVYYRIVIIFFGIGNLFGFLKDWQLLRFSLVVIILAFAFYSIMKVLNYLKGRVDIDEWKKTGRVIARERVISETVNKVYKEDKD